MPEDQNGSLAPEPTDGHVRQQEPAHKPSSSVKLCLLAET